MKAVVISKTGGPEVLEIKDIKLEDPKSGEVLIKNKAIGLFLENQLMNKLLEVAHL